MAPPPIWHIKRPRGIQKRLMSALEGLDGVLCIADDILVYGEGTTYQEAEKDHDRRLAALMECCSKKNIKLNQSILQFKLKQVKFMGNVKADRGMEADPDKIAAISAMTPPETKQVFSDSWEWPTISHPIVQTSAPLSGLSPNSPSQIPPSCGRRHKMTHLTKPNTSFPLHQCSNIMTSVKRSHFKSTQVKWAAPSFSPIVKDASNPYRVRTRLTC